MQQPARIAVRSRHPEPFVECERGSAQQIFEPGATTAHEQLSSRIQIADSGFASSAMQDVVTMLEDRERDGVRVAILSEGDKPEPPEDQPAVPSQFRNAVRDMA